MRQAVERRLRTTFSSLSVRNYRIYFAGQFVSVAGNWAQNVALPWLILTLSHNGAVLGLASAARYAPVILLGPWGGLVADRYDRRTILRVVQALSAVICAAIAILIMTDAISVLILVPLMFLQGTLNAFGSPARQSFISEIVPRDQLPNAIAINSVLMNSARVIGPAIAGVLIATVGIEMCFWLNGVSFAAVILSISLMRESELNISGSVPSEAGQIRAGLRYVAGTPVLLSAMTMITVTGILTWEFQITLPMMATGAFHGNATTYGTLLSALGAGAVVGGLIAAQRVRVTVRSLTISSVLWGIAILAAALAPSQKVSVGLLVVVGVGSVSFNSQAKTILQLASLPAMRGRVMALWSTSWQGSTLIGGPIMGAIGQFAGPRYALGLGGVAAVVSGGGFLAWYTFTRNDILGLDHAQPVEEPVSGELEAIPE